MAETDLHRDEMVNAIQTLDDHFANRPNVYVSGNLLLFYEEGNRRKHVSPDVLVAIGVAQAAEASSTTWSGRRARPPISSSRSRRRRPGARIEEELPCIAISSGCQSTPVRPAGRLPGSSAPGLPAGRRGSSASSRSPAGSRATCWACTSSADGQRLRLWNPATGEHLLNRREKQEAAHRRADDERRRADDERRRARGRGSG